MPQVKFYDLVFDLRLHKLYRRKVDLAIRPKVAQCLALFLENPNQLLSKQALFDAVWGQVQVQDHVLFQVISDIRKLLPEAELIRTQPNAGYIWVAPVKLVAESRPFTSKSLALATAASVLVIALGSHSLKFTQRDSGTKLLPGLSAYAKGVVLMENGDAQRAIEMFQFALTQNPDSEEAGLMLAESLFQAKQFEAAKLQTHILQQQANMSKYTQLAIADLQSRIYAEQGDLMQAVDAIFEGVGQQQMLAQCTAYSLENSLESRFKSYQFNLTPGQTLVNQDNSDDQAASARLKLLMSQISSLDLEIESKDKLCAELNSSLIQEVNQICEPKGSTESGQWLASREEVIPGYLRSNSTDFNQA